MYIRSYGLILNQSHVIEMSLNFPSLFSLESKSDYKYNSAYRRIFSLIWHHRKTFMDFSSSAIG